MIRGARQFLWRDRVAHFRLGNIGTPCKRWSVSFAQITDAFQMPSAKVKLITQVNRGRKKEAASELAAPR
jgi:hypothetical protein